MIESDNRTGWPHATLPKTGPAGEVFDVVVIIKNHIFKLIV